MMQKQQKSGLIMTEVLVAVSMLAVGAVVLGALITNAVSANRIAREYLIAHNLVTEEIEGVKNIRDTNWLTRPGEKEDCWLLLDPVNGTDCATQSVVPGERYVPTNDNGSWHLTKVNAQPLDLEAKSTGYETFRLYVDNSAGYEQFIDALSADSGDVPSPYYRSLQFSGTSPISTAVFVKIQWISESKVRTVERKVLLYNYL